MGRLVLRGQQVLMELLDRRVQLDRKEPLVLRGQRVQLDRREPLELG